MLIFAFFSAWPSYFCDFCVLLVTFEIQKTSNPGMIDFLGEKKNCQKIGKVGLTWRGEAVQTGAKGGGLKWRGEGGTC